MEQLGLAREQFQYAQQQDQRNWDRISPLIDQQMRIADNEEHRAQDYYDYERNTFRPLEQSIVSDAENYNTEGKREELAGKAASDVEQQMGVARESAARNLARYGINPNSGKFAAVNKDMAVQEGLARAGAANNARTQAEEIGHARMMDAAALGRGIAQNSSTAAGLALSANQGASGTQLATSNAGFGMRQGAVGDFGMAQGGFGTAGGLYNAQFGQQMSGYNSRMGLLGDIFSGLGTAAGFMWGPGHRKDGGPVDGPGGSRDDAIPMMVSDGEYVVPAAVVRELGVKHFDKLIEQHGSDDNKKALAERKGLQLINGKMVKPQPDAQQVRMPTGLIGVRG
jgi:hypothetical protein